jgi:hypothetical protein
MRCGRATAKEVAAAADVYLMIMLYERKQWK